VRDSLAVGGGIGKIRSAMFRVKDPDLDLYHALVALFENHNHLYHHRT
jgi:hypothetical protein